MWFSSHIGPCRNTKAGMFWPTSALASGRGLMRVQYTTRHFWVLISSMIIQNWKQTVSKWCHPPILQACTYIAKLFLILCISLPLYFLVTDPNNSTVFIKIWNQKQYLNDQDFEVKRLKLNCCWNTLMHLPVFCISKIIMWSFLPQLSSCRGPFL